MAFSIEKYLEEHNLSSTDKIIKHIEELKRNTIPNIGLITILEGTDMRSYEKHREVKKITHSPHLKSYYPHNIIAEFHDNLNNNTGIKDSQNEGEGVKETENKVDYGELDFDYIDAMALRMTKNLDKYPPKNWQKSMDIKELAKSAIRHARKILQPIENDTETLEEHATALGANGMMINYQLKNK